ncbi:MAG: DUF4012 domain-containing protein, partial [Chloroflexi bacterium]|nr:DUF4012 domain-containing protein [Chloroflexota bacterium]
MQQAKGELFLAEEDLDAARSHIGWLAAVPGFAPAAEANGLLKGGSSMVDAAQQMIDGLAPVVDALNTGGPTSAGQRVALGLQAGHDDVHQARPLLEQGFLQFGAALARGALPDAVGLNGIQQRLASLIRLARLLDAAPYLLGDDAPRRYMVAAENPADLRATGGFLGSWGFMTMQDGRLTGLDYHGHAYWPGGGNGSLIKNSPGQFTPPEAWARYETAPNEFAPRIGWWAEDANWFPDFPTSAQVMQGFAGLAGRSVDGVVTVDTYAIQDLLRATGPVTVAQYGETISADNLVDRLDSYEGRGAPGGRPASERGDDMPFLSALADDLVSRLTSADRGQLLAAGRALVQAADEKHVLVAIQEADAAATLEDLGWDGSLSQGAGDSLMLVDQNTTYVKIATHVDRSVDYHLTIARDLSSEAEVDVTYTNHQATIDNRVGFTSDFRNYARLYVPLGATLESDTTGFDGQLD